MNEALAHQGVDFGAEIEKLREEVARLKDKTAVVRLDIDNRIAMANVERDDAVEQMNTWYKANKSLCDVIKERDEALVKAEKWARLVDQDTIKIKSQRLRLEDATAALDGLVNSEVVKGATMIGYSEAYVNARETLRKLKEKTNV